jgi:hypothetical protein
MDPRLSSGMTFGVGIGPLRMSKIYLVLSAQRMHLLRLSLRFLVDPISGT